MAQKRDIAVCVSKTRLLSKKSATKFLCLKTSSGNVVATSFHYPTVHRSIAGDVPIYLKLAFKVTHPAENADLYYIHSPWRAKKFFCCFICVSYGPYTLLQNDSFFTFIIRHTALRLNVEVTAYGRQTVLDRGVVRSFAPLQVGYINSSNRMTYYQQKRRGYGHVTVLKFCRLLWCSVSRGFVSDSWATCLPCR